MSDESPKKLDNLFRQGSEQYDFEYNAEAWEGMETLLDKDVRRRRFFWWWLGGFGVVALMVGVILFLGNDQAETVPPDSAFNEPKQINTNTNQKEPIKTDIEKKGGTYISENEKEAAVNQKNENKNELNNNKELPGFSENIKNSQQQKNKARDGHFPKREIKIAGNNNTAVSKTPPPINDLINNNNPPQVISQEKENTSAEIKNGQSISENNPALDTFNNIGDHIFAKKTALIKIPFLPLAILKYNKKIPLPYPPILSINAEDATENAEENTPTDNDSKDAWIVGLATAAEVTSVGTDHFSDFSWKLGGHIEYRFFNKYSASLGANYIRKKYDVGAGEYIPPKGFWTNGIAPVATDARCNILELPLLLSYYPKGYSNSGFFGNIGMTSYIMLRERYTYTYEDPAPDSIIGWGTDNEYQTWFGIGQVSLGYNHILGNKTSLQYLPYLQIPLAGVGHGNVKLWSFGMSLKFNFKAK